MSATLQRVLLWVFLVGMGVLVGYLVWGRVEPPIRVEGIAPLPPGPRIYWLTPEKVTVVKTVPATIPATPVPESEWTWGREDTSLWEDPPFDDTPTGEVAPIIFKSAFHFEVTDPGTGIPIVISTIMLFNKQTNEFAVVNASLDRPLYIPPKKHPFWKDAFLILGGGAMVYGILEKSWPVAGVGAGLVIIRFTL